MASIIVTFDKLRPLGLHFCVFTPSACDESSGKAISSSLPCDDYLNERRIQLLMTISFAFLVFPNSSSSVDFVFEWLGRRGSGGTIS